MSYVILHINEFNYLLYSGSLRMHDRRLAILKSESDGIDVFRTAGYLKYSSPESYLILRIDLTGELVRHDERDETSFSLDMTDVQEIIPLTAQAEILLRPVIHRVGLVVNEPRFESAWRKFVDEEILRERLQAAIAFVQLFSCEQIKRSSWSPAPDLFLFMLKDLGSGLNEIERRSESAELGVFEFCVRLAHEHDSIWRRDDPKYAGLKQVRESELARKRLATTSFLNSPRVCLALREFEEESFSRFGYSPFSLVAFFEFYRTHSRANGINFAQVKVAIQLLLTYGRTQDASDYAHLVGYALGLDEVTPATYFIESTRFSVFDMAPSQYPRSEDLVVSMPSETSDPFALPLAPDVKHLPLEESQGKTITESDLQAPPEGSESTAKVASKCTSQANKPASGSLEPANLVDLISTSTSFNQSDPSQGRSVSPSSDDSLLAEAVIKMSDVGSDLGRQRPGASGSEGRADVTQVPQLPPVTEGQSLDALAVSSTETGSEDLVSHISKNARRKGSKTKRKDQNILPVSEKP